MDNQQLELHLGFIRERITELRLEKNVAESRMSQDLGYNKNYIEEISSGRSLPSLPGLLNIMEYLDVSPKEFFSEDVRYEKDLQLLMDYAVGLDGNNFAFLIETAKHLHELGQKENKDGSQ